ncbi:MULTISPECIES: hypothetical protein [unclassified Novosphingobium]|uniref:hypothetical protein n=1 Tax=unclassified Novosphingobium TaxID=2644732 RepID=UPI00135C77A1|nr:MULTISPECIES: hypothetical protein [unclassified Novosphingobium]
MKATFLQTAALAAIFPALAPVSASAQDAAPLDTAAPWLWAAPALYGFEGGACSNDGSGGAAMVDPLLCPNLGIDQRAAIGAAFAQAVSGAFRNVEASFGAHLPAGATPTARLRGTLAVSLRLTRAALHTVAKPGGAVDAYAPITLTLDITNPATGEVVFTRTRSDIAEGVQSAQGVEAEIARQFPGHLDTAMRSLVAEAAAAFRPYAQTAKVLGSVTLSKGETGYVIDKGRGAGLRSGDGINGDGSVLYAGPDYAVVQAQLGDYRSGQVLSRMATAPVETLARPSVLTVVDGAPQGYSPAWLGQILEDALGSGSALAPVPVNGAFSALRTMALDGAGANLAPDARSLPDYVANVRTVLLDSATRPSAIPGVVIDRHEAYAFVTLVDASGRAIGTWQGHNAIEDKVSRGIRLSPSQRHDAVLRNALEDAAKAISAFRPQPRFAPLSGKSGAMLIADTGGAAGQGQTLPVLRPAGRFPGIAGNVLVPVGKVTTREVVAGGLAVADADVEPLALRGGEVVALEASGVPATMRQTVGQCSGANGAPALDDRGQIAMPSHAAAAPALLAGRMAAPVRLSTLPANLKAYAPSFAGWDRFGAAAETPVDACFVPVIAVVPAGEGYQVTVGYTLHRGALSSGPKIGASGLATRLTPSRMPAGSDADAQGAMLQSDLAAQVLPVAANAAAALKPAS